MMPERRRYDLTLGLTFLCLCCGALIELNKGGDTYANGKTRLGEQEGLCPRSIAGDGVAIALSKVSESVAVIQSGSQIGNGVVISRQGLLLTAAHILKENRQAVVYLSGREAVAARLVRRFADQDLALMQLEGKDFSCVPIAEHLLDPQSHVFILSFQPEGQLRGILYETEVERIVSVPGQGVYIQTNLNLRAGNSGSPIFSEQGTLVGIVSEKIEQVPLKEAKHHFHTLGTSTLFLKKVLKTHPAGY